MIGRQENIDRAADLWSKLAAPLPEGVIQWRQDGRPIMRENKYYARFVAYVDAQFVRERLDTVCPGEWDLTLELLPPMPMAAEDEPQCSFKARLQILGVIREDVGMGSDYKNAATDAFKRAAVRFGIAHELYAYEQNWVQVDGEGRYAKPLEDPAVAYARRYGGKESAASQEGEQRPGPTSRRNGASTGSARDRSADVADPERAEGPPTCPKCGGRMWDNRLTKRNPRAPDFKCRDRSCDGVIWPPKPTARAVAGADVEGEPEDAGDYDERNPPAHGDDDLPF